jgi:hypothetical protein
VKEAEGECLFSTAAAAVPILLCVRGATRVYLEIAEEERQAREGEDE